MYMFFCSQTDRQTDKLFIGEMFIDEMNLHKKNNQNLKKQQINLRFYNYTPMPFVAWPTDRRTNIHIIENQTSQKRIRLLY